jgi:hypothetical protein
MRHHLGRTPTWLALATSAVIFAGTQGCGGNDPLAPAHSTSFFPVRGTSDSGAAAGTLHWVYRINGGQPLAAGTAVAGATIQFSDEDITAQDGAVIKTSLQATLAGSNTSGHESVDETDQLTPGSSPATISARDVHIALSASGGGMQLTEALMFHYLITPAQATFFDRDDLDSLAAGFTESQDTQLAVTGSVTATVTSAGTQSQTVSMTIPSSTSWVLVDKLPTFQVLGHDYANVVEVQTTTTAVDPTTGASQQGNANIWLAKGIGTIREEQTGSVFDTSGPITTELVTTNLVP